MMYLSCLFVFVVSVSNVTALLQCLTLIRQHQLSTADVTVQDLKIADYGNSFTPLDLSSLSSVIIQSTCTERFWIELISHTFPSRLHSFI